MKVIKFFIVSSFLLHQNIAFSDPNSGMQMMHDIVSSCKLIEKTGRKTPLPIQFSEYLKNSFENAKAENIPNKYLNPLKRDLNLLTQPGNLTIDKWNTFHLKLLAIYQVRYINSYYNSHKSIEKTKKSKRYLDYEKKLNENLEKDIEMKIGYRSRVRIPHIIDLSILENLNNSNNFNIYRFHPPFRHTHCDFATYQELGINALNYAFSENTFPIGITSKEITYDGITTDPGAFAYHDSDHSKRYVKYNENINLFSKINAMTPNEEKQNMQTLYFYDIHEELHLCDQRSIDHNRFSQSLSHLLKNNHKPRDLFDNDHQLIQRIMDTNDLSSTLPACTQCNPQLYDLAKEVTSPSSLASFIASHTPILRSIFGPLEFTPTDFIKAKKIAAWLDTELPKYCTLKAAMRLEQDIPSKAVSEKKEKYNPTTLTAVSPLKKRQIRGVIAK